MVHNLRCAMHTRLVLQPKSSAHSNHVMVHFEMTKVNLLHFGGTCHRMLWLSTLHNQPNQCRWSSAV